MTTQRWSIINRSCAATACTVIVAVTYGCGEAEDTQQTRQNAREAEGLVVVSKRIVLSGGDDLLVAVVKNTSATTAVRVQPNYPFYRNRDGEIIGTSSSAEGIDHRPTIAPSAYGVILDATGDPALAAETVSIEELEPTGRRVSARFPMLSLSSAQFDRDRCKLQLRLRNVGDRPVSRSGLTAVWNLTRTEILDAEVTSLDQSIPPGARRTLTFALAERYCRARSVDLYVTPTLSEMARDLRAGGGATRLRVVAK